MMAMAAEITVKKTGAKLDGVADGLAEKRAKVKKRKPVYKIEFGDVFDPAAEDKRMQVFAKWLGERAGHNISKLSGAAKLWLMEYMVRAFNALTLDNALLRKMEQAYAKAKVPPKGKKQQFIKNIGPNIRHYFKSVIKKNPAVFSYLSYYMMMSAVLLGGRGVYEVAGKDNDSKTKKEIRNDQDSTWNDDTVLKYEEFAKINGGYVNPNRKDYVKAALEAYWPEIAIGLTELETYRAKPVVHQGEKRATNGLGCTWTYTYDKNGVLRQAKNIAGKTKTLTKEQNYEQVRCHLIASTLPMLKKVTKGKTNITRRQAIALVLAGYQRPADMVGIATKIAEAKTSRQIADAFTHYNGPEGDRVGTMKRRWVCAAYAIGAIDIQDLLNMTRDSFSIPLLSSVYKNGHFLLGKQTVNFVLGCERKNYNKVGEFLSDFEGGRRILVSVAKNNNDVTGIAAVEMSEEEKQIEKSMEILNKGNRVYKSGEYEKAVVLYEDAIKANENNMEAYSSLALAYLRLGDETKDIRYYNKCINAVVEGNKRMNANVGLLMDRGVKAASYYNAGKAREKMGNIYRDKKDIVKANECYAKAKINYETALENAKLAGLSKSRQDVYQKAINRMKAHLPTKSTAKTKKAPQKKKKVAFNDGMNKIKYKGFLVYEPDANDNSMA